MWEIYAYVSFMYNSLFVVIKGIKLTKCLCMEEYEQKKSLMKILGYNEWLLIQKKKKKGINW